tara:strand:+ start:584 stop:739 length:156 start_codon:yes stop_codon:yes gene_type:complete
MGEREDIRRTMEETYGRLKNSGVPDKVAKDKARESAIRYDRQEREKQSRTR